MSTNEEAANIMSVASRILDEKGWCQGEFTDSNGRVCLYEAMAEARRVLHGDSFHAFHEAAFTLQEITNAPSVWWFNDEEAQSVEDVKLAMKKTIYELNRGS